METPVQLGGIALVDVPNGAPDPKLTQVVYRNLKKGFEFQFGRDWHMVNQMPDGKLVLRLIDMRGEFIAQCTLTPWTQREDADDARRVRDDDEGEPRLAAEGGRDRSRRPTS